MKFLVFNWRDIGNPLAGGAEILTHEITSRWVKWGHEVTLFTSHFDGGLEQEDIDGIHIIRQGNHATVIPRAWAYYRKHLAGRYDVIIEEVNGLVPFYTHYYAREPVISMKHQNGRNFNEFKPKNSVMYYELPPFVRMGVYIVEPLFLQYFKRFPMLVLSESTRKDFLDLDTPPGQMRVLSKGINVKPVERLTEKNEEPTFVYLGRLKKSKRLGDILEAVGMFKERYPEVRLWVIGRGSPSYEAELRAQVRRYNIEPNTTFFGYLRDEEKNRLLRKAHAILVSSIREGWGLIVTEANAMGTPAIGYDVPGLRDSIRDGRTGLLVPNGNSRALGQAMLAIIENKDLQRGLSRNAWEWSKEFNWDNAARVCLKHVNDLLASFYRNRAK